MAHSDALVRGREAFVRREWREAYAQLSAADAEAPLEPDDLERLAAAAYLVGEEPQAMSIWTRAHHELVDCGDVARAARWGFWLSLNLLLAGEVARSTGWLARTERLLKDHRSACVEVGYGRIVSGLMAMGRGDVGMAGSHFDAALTLGEQFGDTDLVTISLLSQGQHLIQSQRIAEGIARLDEAMLAVTADHVAPIFAGIVYCAVILTCQRIFDLHRAQEWTLAMNEWCASQPDLMPFRGQCLVHRSEILQLRGEWADALKEAERACEQLSDRSEAVVGRAYYQRGELHRLLGEFAEADRMYREAARNGYEPQPGLCLLRLAQGEREAAAAAMRSAVACAGGRQGPGAGLSRPNLLGPFVDILLAVGDLEAARAAAAELAEIAARLGASFLLATSAQAAGSVLLAQGEPEAALSHLREAWTRWQQLEMPFEAARVQVLLARVCRELGDRDTAKLHFESARSVFMRLRALPDLNDLDRIAATGGAGRPGGLTDRELEVLVRVAAGETNRAIAAALAISEHTVARHLSNIYNKLGVTSRTAASAIAHENKLL